MCQRGIADEETEHIKDFLSKARDQAVSEYTRILKVIRDEQNVQRQIYKQGDVVKSTNEGTYLCIQCPNVGKTREKHRKDHPFSEFSLHPYTSQRMVSDRGL
jgi:ubiquitin carboxyl-terminal hydrolase 22/27/51